MLAMSKLLCVNPHRGECWLRLCNDMHCIVIFRIIYDSRNRRPLHLEFFFWRFISSCPKAILMAGVKVCMYLSILLVMICTPYQLTFLYKLLLSTRTLPDCIFYPCKTFQYSFAWLPVTDPACPRPTCLVKSPEITSAFCPRPQILLSHFLVSVCPSL